MTSLYQVAGFDPEDLNRGLAALASILKHADAHSEALCVSLHSRSLDLVAESAAQLGTRELSMYGWREFPPNDMHRLYESKVIRSARIQAERNAIVVAPHWELPFYDWNEIPTSMARVTFERSVDAGGMSLAQLMEPQQDMLDRIRRTLSLALGPECLANLRFSSCALDRIVLQSWMLVVPFGLVRQAISSLSELFGKVPSVGSIEIAAEVPAVRLLMDRGEFLLSGYPDPGLHRNPFGASFALAPEGVLYPVPNATLEQASKLAFHVWRQRQSVSMLSLKRAYLPWSSNGSPARRSRGNTCSLTIDRGRIRVNVELEQFCDTDVPVRVLRRGLEKPLGEEGFLLKRI